METSASRPNNTYSPPHSKPESNESEREDNEFLEKVKLENRESQESLSLNFITKSSKGMKGLLKQNTPQTSEDIHSSISTKFTSLTAPNSALKTRLKSTMQNIQVIEGKITEKDEYIAELEKAIANAKKKSQVLVLDTEKNTLKDKRAKELKQECKELEDNINEVKRKVNRLEMVNGQLAEKIKSKAVDCKTSKAESHKILQKLKQSEERREKLNSELNKYILYILIGWKQN